jgi:hypothetical protein
VHGRRARELARLQLELLHSTVAELPESGPLQSRLARILEAARHSFPLAAAVVRGTRDELLAASEGGGARPLPGVQLDPGTLLPAGIAAAAPAQASLPLPAEGARLGLVVGQRPLGWLDLYGNGVAAGPEARAALAAVARALAALLADAERR